MILGKKGIGFEISLFVSLVLFMNYLRDFMYYPIGL